MAGDRPIAATPDVIGAERAGTRGAAPCDPPSPSVFVRRIDASSLASNESTLSDDTVRQLMAPSLREPVPVSLPEEGRIGQVAP